MMKSKKETAKSYCKAFVWVFVPVGLAFFANVFAGSAKHFCKDIPSLQKLAKEGGSYAQNNLGGCYYDGNGVKQDLVEAVKWYRKAAEQGYADAQFNLGLCYYNGDGVEKNLTEAVKWHRKAAEQGAGCCAE